MKKNISIASAILFAITITGCDFSMDKTCIVSFDSNGGSYVESQEVKKGEKATKPDNPTKTGYTFDKWTYQNEEWSFVGYVVVEDITLLANWVPISYNINYELDGGDNNPSNPTNYTIEDSFYLSNPSKKGYTFAGWEIDGKSVTSISKGTYGDLTIHAIWSINSYSVVINNDSSKGIIEGDGLYNYESNVTLVATPNDGYSFAGWYEMSEMVFSGTTYEFVMPASDVIFDTRWELIVYNISYKLDGGINDSNNPSTYTIIDEINLLDPIKSGFTFAGWELEEKIISNIPAGTFGDITLKALWSINSYSINVEYDSTKGIVEGSGTYEFGSKINLEAIPNDGYLFDSWSDDSGNVFYDNPLSVTIPAFDVVYRANWITIPYAIIYNLDGGTNNLLNPNSYTVEDEINLFNPTRTGYTFAGWELNGEIITKISKGTCGVLMLKAKWNINQYTVTFKNYDGTILGTKLVNYGETAEYAWEEPTKPSTEKYKYEFIGWDISLENIQSDCIATALFEEKLIYYTVTFNNYDGSFLCSTDVAYGESAFYPSSIEPYKPDTDQFTYEFIGWDISLENIQSDCIATAQYSEEEIEFENLGVFGEFKIDYLIDEDANHIYDVLNPEAIRIYIFNRSNYKVNQIEISVDSTYLSLDNSQFIQKPNYLEICKEVLENEYSSNYGFTSLINLHSIKYLVDDEEMTATTFDNIFQLGIVNSDEAIHVSAIEDLQNLAGDYDYFIIDCDIVASNQYYNRSTGIHGVVNGNGHTVTANEKLEFGLFNSLTGILYNLKICGIEIELETSYEYSCALIRVASDYVISKVSIESVSISLEGATNNLYASFLVAMSKNGSIERVSVDSSSLIVNSHGHVEMAGLIGNCNSYNYSIRDSIMTNSSMIMNTSSEWCTLAGMACNRVYSLKRNIVYNCNLEINTYSSSNFGGMLYEVANEVTGCMYLKNTTVLNKPSHPPLIIWSLEVYVSNCYYSIDNTTNFNLLNDKRRDGEAIKNLYRLQNQSFYKQNGYRAINWDFSNLRGEEYGVPYLK